MTGTTADVVVAGAGISGLSTAFWLTRAGLRVTVLEASARVGGAFETWRPESEGAETGWVFEQGPNTVLESPEAREALGELLRDSGLESDRLDAATESARRWVYHDGELHLLPTSPPGILSTSLFSPTAKMRLLREPFVGRGPEDREEAVAELVRRRLGPEILERAVEPYVSGVWAGDPERLSAAWATPRLVELERRHGSLLKGLLARKEENDRRPALVSVEGGFGRLVERLAETVGDVRLATPVTAVEAMPGDDGAASEASGGFRVHTAEGEPLTARHVVLAIPAEATAQVLEDASGGRSGLFADLPYAPLAVVSLGYAVRSVEHPLDGFGFLAPRSAGLEVLGCLFASSIFPRRAPAGHVALTAFLGGRTAPDVVRRSEDEIRGLALRDLDRVLGLTGEARVEHVRRWPRALPQYELGHGRFVQRAAEIERDLPGLHFAVNWLEGPSVAECVRRARRVACEVLREHPEAEAEPIC